MKGFAFSAPFVLPCCANDMALETPIVVLCEWIWWDLDAYELGGSLKPVFATVACSQARLRQNFMHESCKEAKGNVVDVPLLNKSPI